jgi:hypothetical protein
MLDPDIQTLLASGDVAALAVAAAILTAARSRRPRSVIAAPRG